MFSTEFLDLPPLSGAIGSVTLPGSKSISNRVLLLAALCEGTTHIHDLLNSDDTRVMLEALKVLGCEITHVGPVLHITGLGGNIRQSKANLFLGNAGTAMRPLTAALAVLGGDFELGGVARMHERPIGDLVSALHQLGCTIEYLGNDGFPPLRIGKPQLKLSEPIKVRGDVSSQFLTALLMAMPLVAKQDVVIEVLGELISRPYIEITLNLLARFGVSVAREGWQRFTIPAGAAFKTPGTLHVEADASSASYFIALGAIASSIRSANDADNGITIHGVGADSIQGDIRFMDAAQKMGARIDSGPNWLRVQRGVWPLNAIDLDCNHIPDAAMTLAVMALYANGTTTLRNIASWRVKETDRIAAMAIGLRKLGAQVEEGADFISITPPRACRHGNPQAFTPMTTIASPCVFHWQRLTRVKFRFALKTRNALRRPSPITLKHCLPFRLLRQRIFPCFAWTVLPPQAKAPWLRIWPKNWATTFWIPAPCTGSPDWPQHKEASLWTLPIRNKSCACYGV